MENGEGFMEALERENRAALRLRSPRQKNARAELRQLIIQLREDVVFCESALEKEVEINYMYLLTALMTLSEGRTRLRSALKN